MKILWITNTLFPAQSKYLGITPSVTGGWMYSSAKALLNESDNIELAIACTGLDSRYDFFCENGILYFILPNINKIATYPKKMEQYWKLVIEKFSADIVHIHGTEFTHGLAFLKTFSNIKSVVSIQGLISGICPYYRAGMTINEIVSNLTIRDIIKSDDIFQQQKKFNKRALYECEILRNTKHVIGRTSWDKANTLAINPQLQYHFCNETLRDEFYLHEWSYDKCEKHSIFLSQGSYPLKGLHIVLKALPFVINKYPSTHLYVAGPNIIKCQSIKDKIKLGGYGRYVLSLIERYKLSKHITFLGSLPEIDMCSAYLRSNLFICPSSIENSPNSLGEAQLLGVPSLASYVGGIPDMMIGLESNLYRYEEYHVLAYKICEIFGNESNVNSISRSIALKRHDKKNNSSQLLKIYDEILTV